MRVCTNTTRTTATATATTPDDHHHRNYRNHTTGSALFAIALAWHDGSGSYLITTLNSTAPVAKSITAVAFIGADLPDLKWSIAADGAHVPARTFLRARARECLCLLRVVSGAAVRAQMRGAAGR